MTNSIIQGGVLQIYLQDSNTSLNYKLMASLTSHTKQHERLISLKRSSVKIKEEQNISPGTDINQSDQTHGQN
jgi:hypothetical protein